MQNMGRLKDKVAVVTGAGRIGNIGVAVCDAYLREGCARVIATDISTTEASSVVEMMEKYHGGGRFKFIQHDATSEVSWERLINEVLSIFGHLDILVNNAGISTHTGILDTSLDDLHKTMAVNHDALFLGIKACAPLLEESVKRHSGGGVIVNNVSMASYMANPNDVGYSVSKAAARMLTLCAAKELGPKKIRVNSVHPGMPMTPLVQEGMQSWVNHGVWGSVEEAEASLSAMRPLNMTSQPEDTAHAFVYLASDEARFMTGAAIYHDGCLAGVY